MFNAITPFESAHVVILFMIIIVAISIGIYFGNKAYQEYNLKKIKLEQDHNKAITGMNIVSNEKTKTLDLQKMQQQVLLANATEDPQNKQFPKDQT